MTPTAINETEYLAMWMLESEIVCRDIASHRPTW